jgi:hypothetical protein
MEYMALGKPIVQFDLGKGWFSARRRPCMPRGTTRWPTTSPARFSGCSINPQERERMGQIGRKRVSESLAWQYAVLQLLSAYDRAFSQ